MSRHEPRCRNLGPQQRTAGQRRWPARATACLLRSREEGDAANSAPQETAADRRDYPWLPSGSEPDSAPSRPTGGLPWCSLVCRITGPRRAAKTGVNSVLDQTIKVSRRQSRMASRNAAHRRWEGPWRGLRAARRGEVAACVADFHVQKRGPPSRAHKNEGPARAGPPESELSDEFRPDGGAFPSRHPRGRARAEQPWPALGPTPACLRTRRPNPDQFLRC